MVNRYTVTSEGEWGSCVTYVTKNFTFRLVTMKEVNSGKLEKTESYLYFRTDTGFSGTGRSEDRQRGLSRERSRDRSGKTDVVGR